MQEIFLPITRTKLSGRYLIGSFGNVKALPNRTRSRERIMKFFTSNAGYCFLDLWDGTTHNHCLIHRLVAECFLSNENNLPQVNHIDGNKKNNRVENLEWVSVSDNRRHAFYTGLQTTLGEKNSQTKLNDSAVVDIFKSTLSLGELSKKYNVSKSTICDIRKGRSWAQITGASPTRKLKWNESAFI